MSTLTWTSNTGGDWTTGADWNPAGLPGTLDTALIGPIAGSYTVTVASGETASVGTLSVSSSTVTVEVDGTLTGAAASQFAVKNGVLAVLNAGTVSVGTNGLGLAGPAGSSATVTASGTHSYLSDAGVINVGICGSGLLQVLNSGKIELTGSNGITTGVSASTATGTVVVSGTGSVLQLDASAGGSTIGNIGQGTVEALNGGSIIMNGTGGIIVGAAPGADLLEVSGSGAVLNESTNGARVAVGGATGASGLLEVLNGGAMVLDGTRAAADSLTGLIVGKLGAGTVLVDGIGSSLTLGDGAIIGYGSAVAGMLTVQNHGSVSNTGTSDFKIGFGVGSGGTVIVNDGTLTNTNGNFIVGGTNAAGSLVVEGGGLLTTGNGGLALSSINAGSLAAASATINGGTWTVFGALHVGDGGVGLGNLLDIKTDGTSSGVVNTGTGGIDVASTFAQGSGAITVENGGTLSGGQLLIANLSNTSGTLSIATGGVATVSNGTIGSGGTVTLSGGILSAGGVTQVNGLISGYGTLIAGLTNAGTVTASGGRLIVTQSIGGTGAVDIAVASTMEVDSGLGFGQAVTFLTSASPEALQLDLLTSTTQSFGLANWQAGDLLVIDNGLTVTGANWLGGGTLEVITNSPTYDFTNVTLAGASSTFITGANFVELICFARGTRITTPDGEVPVERLAIGDTVLTLDGKAEPIVWIGTGRQLVTPGRRSAATPVIVRQGALADNVPQRDLRVTKGHSLFIDDVLIPVEFLVNHRSIVWDDQAREIEVFHIELARHAVLLADGAPAESYRDDGNRWLFHNANAAWHLPPQPPCAPVLTGGALVDAAWRRLLDRAGRPDVPMTDVPDLHLLADGQRLNGRRVGDGVYAFRLRNAPTAVRIASRAAAQDELGQARDPRLLGVAVRRVKLWQGRHLTVLEADDPRWSEGVHAFEADNGFRWTDGNALLPAALFESVKGACDIELHVACFAQYALSEEQACVAA